MQTLWARAAQGCTCNCIFCHSSATALNRRATTTALKRRLRFRDVFTLLYSSFLASAAIADIGRKEAKKVEWENLIKEARDELKALQEQQQARLAAVSWPDDLATEKIHPRPDDWSGLLEWATKERERRKSLGFQELKGPPMSLLKDISAPEIEELMFDKYIARLNSADRSHLWNTTDGHRPLSIKKVKTLEWSVRKLVHRWILSLLETSKTNSEEQSDQDPTNCQLGPFAGIDCDQLRMKIDRCDRRLDFLNRHSSNTEYWYRFMSPKSPTYSRRSRDDLASADSLNPELHRIFKYVKCDTRKDAWLPEICSVLLFSYVPPDIHTYNLLIINLMKLNQMDDVEAVIKSMHESHIRPNEVTLSAMLKFYTMNDNRQGFLSLLRKIDGQDGGLSLAHPATEFSPMFLGRNKVSDRAPRIPVRITEEEEDYYYEINGYNLRPPGHQPRAQCHSTQKIVERGSMTILDRAVYGAMIHGALKFLGPKKAMQYYAQMVSDGWEAGIKELGPILRYHSMKMKWQAGLAIWQDICKLPEGANRAAVECMLWLCRKCQKHIVFGQVLDYGVRQKLIPPTVWQFTNKICSGNVTGLLRSADSVSSVTLSASPITIARDFPDQSLEALGYHIASTALDLANITLDAPDPTNTETALKIYFSIRRLHRESPASAVHTARQVALQGLAKKAHKDKERQGKHIKEVFPEDMEFNSAKIRPLETNRVIPNLQEKANNVTERAHKEKHEPYDRIRIMPTSQLLGTHESREYPQTSETAILEPQSACQSIDLVSGDLEPEPTKTIDANTDTKSTKQLATKDAAVKLDQHMTEAAPTIHPLHSPPIQPTQLDQSPSAEQLFDPSTNISTPKQIPSQPTAEGFWRGRYFNKRLTLRASDDASQSEETQSAPPPKSFHPSGQIQPRLVHSNVPPVRQVGSSSPGDGYRIRIWRPQESGSKLGDSVHGDSLVGGVV